MSARRGRRPVLTAENVERIQYLYRNTAYTISQLARLYRVSTATITKAIEGKAKVRDE